MPKKKPGKVVLLKIVLSKPTKIGLPTQLTAIQARYRRAMLGVYDHPPAVRSNFIRAALATLLAEKSALGVKDGEEAMAEG